MAEVLVTVEEEDADPAERERLAGLLQSELAQLDVDRVRPATGGAAAPPGSRGMDVAAVGALVVSLTPTAALVRGVLTSVRAWLGRGPGGRSVELTIGTTSVKLTNASEEAQERLIDEFIRAAAAQG
jgi:hypothetical protein